MSLVVLYQFPVSHYCEKVRWALDYKGLAYEIRNLLPVWHVPTMMRLSRQSQVPVVALEGRIIAGSQAILTALEERFPAAPSLRPATPATQARCDMLVALADREIGPHVRRACYHHVLNDRAATLALLGAEQGVLGKLQLKASLPMIMALMRKGLKVDSETTLRSVDRLNQCLNELLVQLGKRRYFIGRRFSAADLAVASLLAPLARPEGTLYQRCEPVPEGYLELCEQYRRHPLIEWTLDMYQRHRIGHGCNASPRSDSDD